MKSRGVTAECTIGGARLVSRRASIMSSSPNRSMSIASASASRRVVGRNRNPRGMAHGSMPFSAIAPYATACGHRSLRAHLYPKLAARRTDMPVVPPERAFDSEYQFHHGGQAEMPGYLPRGTRFLPHGHRRRLLIEESIDAAKARLRELLGATRQGSRGLWLQYSRHFRGCGRPWRIATAPWRAARLRPFAA